MLKYDNYVFDEANCHTFVDITTEGKRAFAITGFIQAGSSGGRRTQLDAIIQGCRTEEGKLYYPEADRYLNVIRKEPVVYTISMMPHEPYEAAWGARFVAEDPFFYDVAMSNLAVNYTGGAINVENSGGYNTPPVVTLNFTGGATGFSVSNGTKTISHTHSFIANDEVIVNMEDNKVLINGTEDLPAGESTGFFTLDKGFNSITVTPSSNIGVGISFRKRYL